MSRRAVKLPALRDVLGRDPVAHTVSGSLREADRRLSKGRTPEAAAALARGLDAAFDRALHFDSTASPLARDPRGFTRPLERSELARRLRAPRGRAVAMAGGTPAPADADGRPGRRRVVVLTRGNANFLGEILGLLRDRPDVDLDLVDLAEMKGLFRGFRDKTTLVEEILDGRHGIAARAERRLRPLIDGADLVFVEWCTAAAVLLTLVDPGPTRVVVRLHSYEAFTHWPHLIDWSRVDDLLFVSEHLRDFAADAIPGLREEGGPRPHVLPLAMDLQRYGAHKTPDARFTLGLVGWGSVAKDPLWALRVLRLCREQDDRYRLLLVGEDFDGHVSAAAGAYADELRHEMRPLEEAGAVRLLGRRDDVPDVLTGVGVVLSTSVRESFHAGLVEGAASGAVPVVRDWPFFAGRTTSARTLFPAGWVVDTPEEAAARILDATGTEASWRAEGEAALSYALETWDWPNVRKGYERFLLGTSSDGP